MESFGERIRELRKERGITNYEMAMRLGISRNTLTNWERGEKEPHSVEILEEMAKVLNVPLEILLTDEKAVDLENNPAILSLKKRVTRLESICRNIVTAGRAGKI